MSEHLPLRRVRFEYPPDLDPMWNRRLPELACAANALSLLMPHVEPYVVRSARAALPQLTGDLRDQTEASCRQEASHHAQHRRFNALIAARYPGVGHLDRAMSRVYAWLERRGGFRFDVAYAAGAETVAFASARWIDRHYTELFADADPTVSRLFLWHLAEEVEHKSVAFDVHQALQPSRRVLALAMLTALVLMAVFTLAGTIVLLAGERRLLHPVAWFRLTRWSIGYAFEVLPMMAVSLLRGHHPTDFVDPSWFGLWIMEFDAGEGHPVASRP